MAKHFDASNVISHNGIFTMILTPRNRGKTWCFKKRAFKRAVKHGKKTIWLRTFRKEVKECSKTFYTSKDLQQYCGIEWYNPDTKTGNLKQEGNTFYVKRGNTWTWFLKIYALSDSNALRSADDVDVDTIIYDEFTTTADKLVRYRGNVVVDLIDTFISAKREHEVRVFFLGNKENVFNPFLSYFDIKPLPTSYNGIRKYKNNTLVLLQDNTKADIDTDYETRVNSLLQGTTYGNYLYQGSYKNATNLQTRKVPPTANDYIQLNWNGIEIKISIYNGYFYVSSKIDKLKRVYTNKPLHKYKNEHVLVKRQKTLFLALYNAIADSRVYYDSQASFDAIQPFYMWLNV